MYTVVETSPAALQNGTGSSAGLSAGAGGRASGQLPLAVAIFVSAFLLFQVQLILGKEILPLFGGASAVWIVCVFVFELLFLGGYGYSHALVQYLPPRKQAILHGALLGIAAAFLAILGYMRSAPVGPSRDWRPAPGANPTWTIVEFLVTSIGLPFLLLSATSPLLQHWASLCQRGKLPYRLYALSNVGSLLGLVSYPLLVEPHVGISAQRWAWSAGFGIFLASYYFSARSVSGLAVPAAEKAAPILDLRPGEPRAGWQRWILWTSLSACASVLLLATTNLVCEDVAVSPFLWVLELSLYLLSFVVCFDHDRWYRRGIFYPAFSVTVALVIVVSMPAASYSYLIQLAAYSGLLFTGCMVCHGELARSRPRPESLTAFYLCIATGGVVGGIVVSLLAPTIFPNYWEYPLGVMGCIAVLLACSMRDRFSWWHEGRASLALVILGGAVVLTPVVLAPLWRAAGRFPRWAGYSAAAALICAAAWRYMKERRMPGSAPSLVRNAARVVLALFTAGLLIPQKAALYHVIRSSRNFYGVLSVVDVESDNYFVLRDGRTVHGFQYRDAGRSRLATGYYGPGSGANLIIRNWPRHPMRVGLVGMGAGTLAALAQRGDVFRFYEINPDVYQLSAGPHPYFTYLRDSQGRMETVLGDARISLEREADRGELQKFDILVLDAFSSDAIPMHLLTREAFRVYERHLRGPSSVIAVHISNQTLDLKPVLAGIGGEFGFHGARVYPLLPTGPFSQSDWVLLSRDADSIGGDEVMKHSEPFPAGIRPLVWTDDYFDVLRVIRWRD